MSRCSQVTPRSVNTIGRVTQHAESVPKTRCVLTLVDETEPVMSCCVPCSTNRDGVHTPESVLHIVICGVQ